MKEVITAKGKTVLVPDDCDGPRNRTPKWKPVYRYLYTGDVPCCKADLQSTVSAPIYGPRKQHHKIRTEAVALDQV